MQRNHTPGPWDAARKQCHQDFIEITHRCEQPGAASKVLARVTVRACWKDEQEANASLISAAPELFEALEEIVFDGILAHEPGLLSRAKAAVAKATGEQQ